jgi:hypothetical protein
MEMSMETENVATGMLLQAEHCRRNDAPITARIVEAQLPLMTGTTRCGARIAAWQGLALEDALPLRLTGGIHHLHLSGREPRLAALYDGRISDQTEIDALIAAVVADHDEALLPWLDRPPQTNEAGRSASFIAALHWLASRVRPRFALNEIGSSAGMNLLVDRYRYDLGGVTSGPADSPVTIRPDWRGPPPPADGFAITRVRGCDLTPIDVSTDAAADRLMGYIWPEMPQRIERMRAGIAMIRARGVDLVAADAADWAERVMAEPPELGITRVLMHSIVWQYLPETARGRITAAVEAAGTAATADAPVAWIALETNRETFRHELIVRHWPGDGAPVLLGSAHAHGAWVEWTGSNP